MILHQLKCPNCGATLTIENDIDTFFCQYCGTKLIVDGQSDMAIRAKADIKIAEKAIERDRQQQEYEERKALREDKSFNLTVLLVFVIIFFFGVIVPHFFL